MDRKRTKFLIVEGNAGIRENIGNALTNAGYEDVMSVATVADAVASISKTAKTTPENNLTLLYGDNISWGNDQDKKGYPRFRPYITITEVLLNSYQPQVKHAGNLAIIGFAEDQFQPENIGLIHPGDEKRVSFGNVQKALGLTGLIEVINDHP